MGSQDQSSESAQTQVKSAKKRKTERWQPAVDRMIPLRRDLDAAEERGINAFDIKVEIETNPPENLNEDKRIDQ